MTRRVWRSWVLFVVAWLSASCVGSKFAEPDAHGSDASVGTTLNVTPSEGAAVGLSTAPKTIPGAALVDATVAAHDSQTRPTAQVPPPEPDAQAPLVAQVPPPEPDPQPSATAQVPPPEPDNGAAERARPPPDCTSLSCAAERRICDEASQQCRDCTQDSECLEQVPGAPHCAAGQCAECAVNDQCTAATPICLQGSCQGCTQNRQCTSLLCNQDTGRCVPTDQSVYVSGANGRIGNCGTRSQPCSWLRDATAQLSPSRPNLVLLPSDEKPPDLFIELPRLPVPVQLVGNGASISAQVTVHSEARLSDIKLPNVVCENADLTLDSVVLSDAGIGVGTNNCGLEIVNSRIEGMSIAGLHARVGPDSPSRTIRIERNVFINNTQVIQLTGSNVSSVIRNNYFVENDVRSRGEFQHLIVLSGNGQFTYNALVGNQITCGSQVGVSCGTPDYEVSSNLSTGNSVTEDDCVLYRCRGVRYSLAEVPVPGNTNFMGDAQLSVEEGQFILRENSPARDRGDPALAPRTDFHGTPRPYGTGPDIGATEFTR